MRFKLKYSGLILACYSFTGGVFAQEQEAPTPVSVIDADEVSRMGTVTVTALRRESDLQTTASAVTALAAEELARSGIERVEDLQFSVPSLVFSQNGSAFTTLRGIGTQQPGSAVEGGVSMHVDGVYVGRTSATTGSFFDLERVEVLRGPQGTLYGRNATGGSINLISAKPTEEFEAGFTATAGNFGLAEIDGYISGPIAEGVEARLALRSVDRDGYLTNIVGGPDLRDDRTKAARGILRFTPSERSQFDLIFDYLSNDFSGFIAQNLTGTISPFAPAGSVVTSDPRSVAINEDVFYDREHWGVTGIFDYEFDGFALKSITGYRDNKYDTLTDQDATSDPRFPTTAMQEASQFSQEIHFSSTGDGPLDWIIGAIYYEEQSDTFFDLTFVAVEPFPLPLAPPPAPPLLGTLYDASTLNQEIETKSYGVFGEATYWVMPDKLAFSVGGRFTLDEKGGRGSGTDDLFFSNPAVLPFDIPIPIPGLEPFVLDVDEEFDAFTPKVGVQYFANEDTFLYANISQGFKSGNSNYSRGADEPVDPEFVWAYEAGVKFSNIADQLNLNFTGFYYDYEDLQVFAIDPSGATLVAQFENAAAATIWGLEVEGLYRPTDNVSVDFSYGYLNAEYDEYFTVDSFSGSTTVVDVGGNRMPRSPEHSFNIGAQAVLDLTERFTLTPRVEYTYRGETFYGNFENPLTGEDEINLLNARLTLAPTDADWTLSLWGRNLGDTDYLQNVLEGGNGAAGAFWGDPLTWGVEFGVKFGG